MLSKSSLETRDFGIKSEIATALIKHFFKLKLDVFAFRTFHVCEDYYSCGPDSRAIRADAFSVATWPDYSYVFPLPPLISKTLAKIEEAGMTVLIVTPRWTATPWWDRLIDMALREPMRMGQTRTTCIAKTGTSLPRLGTIVATMVKTRGVSHRQQARRTVRAGRPQ